MYQDPGWKGECEQSNHVRLRGPYEGGMFSFFSDPGGRVTGSDELM